MHMIVLALAGTSPSYLDETLAFVVPDHRRAEFSDAEWVRAQKACGWVSRTRRTSGSSWSASSRT
jgi:hypothetical protein